ncbi:CCA tRNA nucleotidyltransferase [Moorena bouillonii]|uniref:[cytidine(C)-cytidine(C)-adenosine (A)]-adding enzyme n=1 Tax=Moorena bouillonii PNG TaxID=568701 RepID=A0A1U7MZD8_9CYAN|nr:CCA tRNA nucleotidyltransferase [Moorena bouillonii]OLT59067.1 [cytidine(C)-cytidine(C)-adenosine (A)]-adding enzyme [Moorena bouillonii PNG]
MTNYQTAISPQNWPFNWELLPSDACLVGGAVRDALINRQSDYLDLDFVLPTKAVRTASKLARRYKAGFVVLDAQRQIARVVFGNATVDFAQQDGDSLEADLHRRDFTINAIAFNPHTKEFIDPLQGILDCRKGIIRMVSPENLQNDPLRLLRAYRQAAQLGFQIDPATQSVLRKVAPLLSQIAAERVRTELGYLLKSPQGVPWLKAAWEDNVLRPWLPDATAESFEYMTAINPSAMVLAETWPKLGVELNLKVTKHSLSLLNLAKLANLLSSIPAVAEQQLLALKYSRVQTRIVVRAIQHLPQLLSYTTAKDIPLRDQYFFFLNVGAVFPVVALLAVARGMAVDTIAPLIEHYLNPNDQVAHPTPLVTGKDLIKSLKLSPSSKIGELLTEIQIARIEGNIDSIKGALEFAAKLDSINCGSQDKNK